MSYAYPMDSILTYDDKGVPQYDRAINSAQLRTLYHELLSDGVLLNNSTNLQVVANSTMNVTVKAGLCNIQGCIKKFEEDIDVTIESASTSYNRIDTIVARLDLNSDYRDIGIFVIKGTPASVPTRPELTRDTNVYEIALADITISANATTLSQSNISDTRLDTTRCGIISCIAEFDTTKLYEQIQTDLKQFQESNEADFEQWFESMKGQLGEDAAGNLQLQIDEHTEKSVPSEVGAHGFRYFEGKLQAHIYDEESMTLKWVNVPGSGIAYDEEKSVQGAIDEVSRYTGLVKSKNLLINIFETKSYNGGGTVTVNKDKSITINGTFTDSSSTVYLDNKNKNLELGKQYVASISKVDVGITFNITFYTSGTTTVDCASTNTSINFTTPNEIYLNRFLLSIPRGTYDNVTVYPMISTEGGEYEPYVADLKSLVCNVKVIDETIQDDATPTTDKTYYTYTATKRCIVNVTFLAGHYEKVPTRVEIYKNGNIISAQYQPIEASSHKTTSFSGVLNKGDVLTFKARYSGTGMNRLFINGYVQYLE